jgi:hypothetical protein
MTQNNQDQQATKQTLSEALPQTRRSVLGKENALIWKAIALQVALIAPDQRIVCSFS